MVSFVTFFSNVVHKLSIFKVLNEATSNHWHFFLTLEIKIKTSAAQWVTEELRSWIFFKFMLPKFLKFFVNSFCQADWIALWKELFFFFLFFSFSLFLTFPLVPPFSPFSFFLFLFRIISLDCKLWSKMIVFSVSAIPSTVGLSSISSPENLLYYR